MGISISALVRSSVTQLSNALTQPSPLGKGDRLRWMRLSLMVVIYEYHLSFDMRKNQPYINGQSRRLSLRFVPYPRF